MTMERKHFLLRPLYFCLLIFDLSAKRRDAGSVTAPPDLQAAVVDVAAVMETSTEKAAPLFWDIQWNA